MAHLIKTTEVYRVETEDEAKKFIEEQKQNDSYEMIKYSSEYKIKKAKGEIEDEWFRVTLVKIVMKINIKKLEPEAIIPTKGSDAAAGVDLYAPRALVIHPGSNGVINTGLAIEIPDGYFGAIFARSGMATRKGLRPANCVGVIDSDYRGEIIVVLHNDTDIIRPVQEGDRIAQLVILPYEKIEFSEVEELTH